MLKKSLLCAHATAIVAVLLLACENKNAKMFLATIDLQERVATDIVISENGTESQKLAHMINHNFDSALLVNERQQVEFDKIIQKIASLPTENLAEGQALQAASIQYYQALKKLYGYAKEEIQQQKVMLQASDEDQVQAQDSLMSLTRAKQKLFQQVYHYDSIFSVVKENFAERYKLAQ